MKNLIIGLVVGAILALLIVVHFNLWKKVEQVQITQRQIIRAINNLSQRRQPSTFTPVIPREPMEKE